MGENMDLNKRKSEHMSAAYIILDEPCTAASFLIYIKEINFHTAIQLMLLEGN